MKKVIVREFSSLQEYQEFLFFFFKRLHKRFKLNNIEWFTHSGSLLGAIRHKGFIPWDDDFDMGMDYYTWKNNLEVIRGIVEDEGEGDWIVRDLYGDKTRWDNPRIHTTGYYKFTWEGKSYTFKPFIDVMLGTFNTMVKLRGIPTIIKAEMAFRHLEEYLPFKPLLISRIFQRKHEKRFGKDLPDLPKNIFRMLYLFSWRQDVYDLTEIVEVPFMDDVMPVPKNYIQALEHSFGEWQKLPKETKQKPKHIIHNRWYVGK